MSAARVGQTIAPKKIYALTVREGTPALESIDSSLKAMQAIVGGYIEHITLRGRFAGLEMFVNEQGRLEGLPLRSCPLYPHEPIAGDYFVTRIGPGGDSLGLTVSDIEILKQAFGGAL